MSFNYKNYLKNNILLKEGFENNNLEELLNFTNENLEELKDYFSSHLVSFLVNREDDEEKNERNKLVNSINKMEIDAIGDAVMPDTEIGVSVKFAEDVDDKFKGEEGDEPEFFDLNGRKMAAIWYNI